MGTSPRTRLSDQNPTVFVGKWQYIWIWRLAEENVSERGRIKLRKKTKQLRDFENRGEKGSYGGGLSEGLCG